MNNWKIGTRITAGFATVLFTTAALGFFAQIRIAKVRENTAALGANYFPSVIALMAIQSNQYHSVSDLMQLCASSDPVLIQKLDEEIVRLRTDQEKDLRFYESTPFTPEEAAVYNESKVTRQAFLSKFADVLKIGRSTKAADVAKSQAMFENELRPLAEKYAGEIQTMVDMNRIGANAGLALIESSVTSAGYGVWIGVVLCFVFAVPTTIFIVRSITVPLGAAVETLRRMAEGDLTVELAWTSRDEVGQMAAALNESLNKLRTTMEEVTLNAAGVSGSSQQLASAADAISSGAQQQAASLEETSASLEQITATVRQSADNAKQASQQAAGSRDSAEAGQHVVKSAVAAMAEINAASAKISDIISTIDEIAFQTNLLAVNAAVEAARAGEEGRGFAVVATEVRSLAQRSAGAAKEIKTLIQDSLRKVEAGSGLVNQSGETLHSIVGSVKAVTDIVSEMAAAAAEQRTGVEQVNTALTQMDQVTQSNAAQTEQLSSTAQALSEQSQRLQQLVSVFVLDRNGSKPHAPAASQRSLAVLRRPVAARPRAAMRKAAVSVHPSNLSRVDPASRQRSELAVPAGHDEDASFEEF